MSAGGAFLRRARLALAVWACSLALYGLYFQGQWVYGERPVIHITGDEPHYLLIATSLLRDGDLDVLNNYRDKHYQPFYPYHLGDARQPEDMHALYGPSRGLYSKHGVGLPLLLLPAMRLGGTEEGPRPGHRLHARRGARPLHADLPPGLGDHGARGGGHRGLVGGGLYLPLLLYAGQIYPEVPGALLVVWGCARSGGPAPEPPPRELTHEHSHRLPRFARLTQLSDSAAGGSDRAALRLGLAVALLPGCTCATSPWRRAGRGRVLARALARLRQSLEPGLAGVARPWWQGRCCWPSTGTSFGASQRAGEYGTFAVQDVLTGTPGLFFDQQFGLLVYAPVYLIALLELPLVSRFCPACGAPCCWPRWGCSPSS